MSLTQLFLGKSLSLIHILIINVLDLDSPVFVLVLDLFWPLTLTYHLTVITLTLTNLFSSLTCLSPSSSSLALLSTGFFLLVTLNLLRLPLTWAFVTSTSSSSPWAGGSGSGAWQVFARKWAARLVSERKVRPQRSQFCRVEGRRVVPPGAGEKSGEEMGVTEVRRNWDTSTLMGSLAEPEKSTNWK